MTIGEKIRAIRKEKGMTQKQLADICKMADSAIRKYESGQVVPKMEMIERIANALGVPAVQLMNRNLQMQMEVDGVNRILFRAQEKYRLAEESGADKTELEGISEVIATAQELLAEISGEKELHTSAEQQAQAALARAEALSQHQQQQKADKKETAIETPESREREENAKLLQALFDEFSLEGQREVLNRVKELSFVPGFRK